MSLSEWREFDCFSSKIRELRKWALFEWPLKFLKLNAVNPGLNFQTSINLNWSHSIFVDEFQIYGLISKPFPTHNESTIIPYIINSAISRNKNNPKSPTLGNNTVNFADTSINYYFSSCGGLESTCLDFLNLIWVLF